MGLPRDIDPGTIALIEDMAGNPVTRPGHDPGVRVYFKDGTRATFIGVEAAAFREFVAGLPGFNPQAWARRIAELN